MSSDDELLQYENLTTGSQCLTNRRRAKLRTTRRRKEEECSYPHSSRSSNSSSYQATDRKRQITGDKNDQSCSSDRTINGEVANSSRKKKHDDMEHSDHSYAAQRRRNQALELNSSNGQTLHQPSPDDVEILRQMEVDEGYAQMIESSPDPWARIRQMEEDERYAQMLQASPDPVEIVRQFEEDERYARMLEASVDPVEQVRQVEDDERYARMLQGEDTEMQLGGSVDRDQYSRHGVTESQANDDVEVESHDDSCDHDESDNREDSSGNESEDHSDSGETLTVSVSVTDSEREDFDESDDANDSDLDNDYESYMEEFNERVPRGLGETEINLLPTRKFQCPKPGATSSRASGDDAVGVDHVKECNVCTYELKDGDLLRILTCFHEFHVDCIDPWLKINRTCPVCRVELKFDDGAIDSS